MLRRAVILFFFALAGWGCEGSDGHIGVQEAQLINSSTCDPSVHPTAYSLIYHIEHKELDELKQANVFGCGATLIAPDVLLTAAHCIDEEYFDYLFEEVIGVAYSAANVGDFGVDERGKVGIAVDSIPVKRGPRRKVRG